MSITDVELLVLPISAFAIGISLYYDIRDNKHWCKVGMGCGFLMLLLCLLYLIGGDIWSNKPPETTPMQDLVLTMLPAMGFWVGLMIMPVIAEDTISEEKAKRVYSIGLLFGAGYILFFTIMLFVIRLAM